MNCMLSIVDYMVYIVVNPDYMVYIYSGKPLNPRVYSMNFMLRIVDYMVYPGKPLNPRVYSMNCMLSIVDYMVSIYQ